MLLGCIGDDFTGSSDLANTLAKGGMRTVQYTGVPDKPASSDIDAGVVALKTRSIDSQSAVDQSLAALRWLQAQGCKQFMFKYCSTFDSTMQGNIGPVADALADALSAEKVIVCPAFPKTGRSVFQGHLFVDSRLLNESGMEHHPLTPMTDPDIRRWLSHQTRYAVGHVDAQTVFSGTDAISAALECQHRMGARHIVVDAIRDEDLCQIGAASKDLPLLTGGSGIAIGLPQNFGCSPKPVPWANQTGKCVALSGSCSVTTRAQVAFHSSKHPTMEISADEVLKGTLTSDAVADWLLSTPGIPLAYSSIYPEKVADIQKKYGREETSSALELFFSKIARTVVSNGVTRLVTAGGETSGAVVESLDVATLEIGPEIDPGVPALRANNNLVLALKSGNFGGEDFFERAAQILGGSH